MTERWEKELAKVDRLTPSEEVHDRIGSVPPRNRDGAREHRALVIVASLAIFLGAALFAWRGLSPMGDSTTPEPQTSAAELPSVVDVTCSESGTEVGTPASVTDTRIHFRVADPGGFDEVLILQTSPGTTYAADMDLSSSLDHTFGQLPPGDYVVGCFTDQETPSGSFKDLLNAPGMQPLQVLDPGNIYVSPELMCMGSGSEESHGFLQIAEATSDDEKLIRTQLDGIESSDLIERSGYPLMPTSPPTPPSTYRIVRDGAVIANMGLHRTDAGGYGGFVDLEACGGSNLQVHDRL